MLVKIAMSEQQAKTMVKALDLYSRIHGLQFDELTYLSYGEKHIVKDTQEMSEDLEKMKKKHFDFGKGTYIGIMGIAPQAQLAYDMCKVILNAISWHKNPDGGITTDFDRPLHVNKNHKLIEVEVTENGKAN